MKQLDIWYADLNPIKGSEQAGFRPVVIVSGNLLNEHLNTVIICPITTKLKHFRGDVILTPNKENKLSEKSEILTFHIRAISKERLVRKIGVIKQKEHQLLLQYLNEILTLN